jgi:hypothetical protein
MTFLGYKAKPNRVTIERRFDYATMSITGYRLLNRTTLEWSKVAREWAEDQVCRGKASYVDVGRNGPLTPAQEGE